MTAKRNYTRLITWTLALAACAGFWAVVINWVAFMITRGEA